MKVPYGSSPASELKTLVSISQVYVCVNCATTCEEYKLISKVPSACSPNCSSFIGALTANNVCSL